MFHRRHILSVVTAAALLAVIPADEVAARPVPEVRINSSEASVAVPQGTGVTVTVGLDPQESRGVPADWWLAANTPFGPLWWTPDNGWVRSAAPVASASRPLVGFTDFVVLTADSLPAGLYTFYFAVDMAANGILDRDQLIAHAVRVTVTPPGAARDPALIGTWNLVRVNGAALDSLVPGALLSFAFTGSTLTTTDADCVEGADYLTSDAQISFTVTSVSGTQCIDQVGDTLSLPYTVSGDALTIQLGDARLGDFTFVFAKVR